MERYHFNHFEPAEQMQQLRHVAYQADLSVAELIRRMHKHCLQGDVLVKVLPHLSGQISLDGKDVFA